MITLLFHAKSSSYFGETRDKFSRLLRLTIQTGFLTSVLSLANIILGGIRTDVYLLNNLPQYILGRSYTVTLLMNINFPRSTQNDASATKLSTLAFTPRRNPPPSSGEGDTRGNGTDILSAERPVIRTANEESTSDETR